MSVQQQKEMENFPIGFWNYRCPNEDDFRWQLNTAIAHGAKGILWFFFYMRYPHDNARLSPIDEHWKRTETFQWLSQGKWNSGGSNPGKP